MYILNVKIVGFSERRQGEGERGTYDGYYVHFLYPNKFVNGFAVNSCFVDSDCCGDNLTLGEHLAKVTWVHNKPVLQVLVG